MNLLLFRLLVDFGLVVLILLVQLIIYPSFTQMSAKDLKRWHPKYTRRITVVVLPLMLSQAILVSIQFINTFSYNTVISLLIVIALWALTFLQAVPLHSKIDRISNPIPPAKELVKVNRVRLFLWFLLFILNFLELLN